MAEVDADTESLYTYIRGDANLKLSGSTQDHIVLKDGISKLTLQDFKALKSTVESIYTELLAASKVKKGRIKYSCCLKVKFDPLCQRQSV